PGRPRAHPTGRGPQSPAGFGSRSDPLLLLRGRREGRGADRLHDALTAPMARVLVTRELPAGGTEPLVDAGHVIVARDGDEPYNHDELVTIAPAVDALILPLHARIAADGITRGAPARPCA